MSDEKQVSAEELVALYEAFILGLEMDADFVFGTKDSSTVVFMNAFEAYFDQGTSHDPPR